MVRSTFLLLFAALCLTAQTRVTAEQVVQFIQTSIRQKYKDGDVAGQVQTMKLTTRLDPAIVTSLQRAGAGPKTVAALGKLAAASASLPVAAASAPAAPKADADSSAPLSAEEQKRMVEAIRDAALAYTENLPNYICAQVTERRVDPTGSGDWRKQDTILETLSYNEHQESYKVVTINDRVATDKKHDQLGGATSSGEFGSILRALFDPRDEAEFQWTRQTRISRPAGDRNADLLSFRVRRPVYGIQDQTSGRSISVGYHGFLWADRETAAILRIKFDCDDIPTDFPIQSVSLDLIYDFVEIAGQRYALPLLFDIKSAQGRSVSWNQARFANYRKFSADTNIIFDAPDTPPEKPVKKQ